MAEALGIAGSVVGIISLGIQVSMILQKQVDDVLDAPEKVSQMIIEVKATAAGLTDLQDLLLQDKISGDNDKIFSQQGKDAINFVVQRCDLVFRNIVVLIAKAGKAVLAQVDDFQRKVKKKQSVKPDPKLRLEIELSNIEHLLWPWRLPKIEQYIADMGRLSNNLLLILAVASLAKNKKITATYVHISGISFRGSSHYG